ncbi:MAG TPA: LuxR C-terminal-related transcriptional regulator, partial [Gaiellaceae bacterium]|nr:LuxR C-terminal-related transcriptional regulator [Gaiellaceae bacterium]
MESVASERFMDLLAQQTPIQMIITSRRRPSWATARRILYGEILEIDRRALAMEDSEAREVLGRKDPAADELIARAKGWPAVLGLASLTDERLPELDLPEALYDYFAEELFQATTADVQLGLSQLAAVGTVSADLAMELLGDSASAILSEGVRIGALTRSGTDFELHPLLSDFLIAKLQDRRDIDVSGLASGAVSILLERQRWDQAFRVVRSLAAAHLMPDLLTAALDDLLRNGRTHTVLQWLDFAEANHLASAVIDLAASEIAFREGRYAKAETLALAALQGLDAGDLRAQALIRAGQSAALDSRDDEALASFRQAGRIAESRHSRLEALVGEGLALLELGLAAEAEGLFAQLADTEETGFETRIRKALVRLMRAVRLGGVDGAIDVAARVLPLLDNLKDPLVTTSFLNTYVYVLVLNARYEKALALGETELEVARQYRLDFVLPHALIGRAGALIGVREFTKAAEEIEAAAGHASHSAHIAMSVAAVKAAHAIQRHEFSDALTETAAWGDRAGSHPGRAELLAYRALAAASLGDPAMSDACQAEVEGLAGRSIEATNLTACARAITAISQDRPDAADVAVHAFRQIEATGAFNSLVIAVRASSAFLAAILSSVDDSSVIARVLTESNDFKLARGAGLMLEAPRRGPMKGLTDRELEVARLVARGYTNQMIADALYISDSTVKVHVRHILEKVGARSRTELAGRIASVE